MKYIVAKIHNSSLGLVVECSSLEEGMDIMREWFKEQFGDELLDDYEDALENEYEVYHEEDGDNTYTFSIGIID